MSVSEFGDYFLELQHYLLLEVNLSLSFCFALGIEAYISAATVTWVGLVCSIEQLKSVRLKASVEGKHNLFHQRWSPSLVAIIGGRLYYFLPNFLMLNGALPVHFT